MSAFAQSSVPGAFESRPARKAGDRISKAHAFAKAGTLISPSNFYEIVSGRRRGLSAGCVRSALLLAELPYSLAVSWRNRRYDAHPDLVKKVPVPVVSVGNLSLGGTGKTPLVAWLARWFRDQGVRVTIVSRGYGASPGARNDEALELESQLPDVPHILNPDRVAAAEMAIEEFECQLIILDDGFQHRRLHRDLDIVLVDATQPFGYGHVFPRGTLREPMRGLSRADVIALTRANLVDDETRKRIRERLGAYGSQAIMIEVKQQPDLLGSSSGETSEIRTLHRAGVAAFCGIGNPQNFRSTLALCDYQVIAFREYPDHHPYSREDIQSLTAWIESNSEVEAVVCTTKDLVKIELEQIAGKPLYAVQIGLDISDSGSGWDQAILSMAADARSDG